MEKPFLFFEILSNFLNINIAVIVHNKTKLSDYKQPGGYVKKQKNGIFNNNFFCFSS